MAGIGQQDLFGDTARQAAIAHGVPPDLFDNLIGIESSWQPYTVSPKGAIGLTQLMPATASRLQVNPWNPMQNLNGGASELRRLYDSLGDWGAALAAYNAGSPSSAAGQAYAGQVLSGVNAAGQSVGPALDASGQVLGTATSGGPGGIFSEIWQFLTDPNSPPAKALNTATGLAQGEPVLGAPPGSPSAASTVASKYLPSWLTPGNVATYGVGSLVVVVFITVGAVAIAMAGWKATPEPVKATGRAAAAVL
jgi:hypothetical protein